MSWRGSTGHLDANVPDYQKMLQGRSPSSGWSSTQPSVIPYSSRFPGAISPGVGLLSNIHPKSASYGHNLSQGNFHHPQSKYGGTAESSINSPLDSKFAIIRGDSSNGNRKENGYPDRNYGYVGGEFDLEPYRSSSHRGTNYSSDSGKGHHSKSTPDYSSDSGLNFRKRSQKSNDLDLETPSLDTSHNQPLSQNNELFSSPVKSQRPVPDFVRHNDKGPMMGINIHEQLSNYRHISISEPNLDKNLNVSSRNGHGSDEGESSPRENDSSPREKENEDKDDDDNDRLNFISPTLYHGDISDTALAQRNKSKGHQNKMVGMSHWQQMQRNLSTLNTRVLKSPLSATHHIEKPYIDYAYNVHDEDHHDPEIARHLERGDMVSSRLHSPNEIVSPRHQTAQEVASTRSHNSEQLNQIRSAADAIIRDKDAIINKQQDRIVTLEESIKEYESKLRRSLMSRLGNHEPQENATFSKMQELEYRNAELRSDLAKLKLEKETELEDLQIKLGGVEHEVVQLKAALRRVKPDQAEMRDKLTEKEKEIVLWKSKHCELTVNYEMLNKKLEKMERYMADLPTTEEFTKTAEDLIVCREDNDLKAQQLKDLEDKLNDKTKELSDRETMIMELEGKQQQLADKMRELTIEIRRIKSDGEGKALAKAEEELAETKEIKEKISQDLEKAKKLLEINHRRLRQLEAKHQQDTRQLQERLGQEEESVTALREEIHLKEEQIARLRKSLKEFASKNQDLMDENLTVKEQLQQFEKSSIDENQQLQRKFVREMNLCFLELKALVQICVQQADGKEPNISLLLGSRASLDEQDAAGASMGNEQSLKHCFTKLKELRSELDKIRDMLCNKYAKDMGDNLNCATQ